MKDWMIKIHALAQKEGLWKKAPLIPIPAEEPKNILIYGTNPWFYGGFERMVSVALRLRGHNVTDYYCNGGFPACGMEYYTIRRPDCASCIQQALAYYEVFDIKPQPVNDFEFNRNIDFYRLFLDMGFQECYSPNQIILNNFKDINYEGLQIGKRVFEKVFWYFGGILEDKKTINRYILKCAITYIMHVHIAKKIFDSCKYDVTFLHSGTTIQISPFLDVANHIGIDAVTWWSRTWNFDHGEPAFLLNHNNLWEIYRHFEHSSETINKNYANLINWKKAYHSKSVEDVKEIRKLVPYRNESYKILVLMNYFCDASMIGIDSFFESGLDMYLYFVEYAKKNPDIDLFLRIHPTEKKLKTIDYDKGIFGKVFLMDDYFADLKNKYSNIHVIFSDSDISTYTLLKLSDAVFSYTSTLSVEAPLQGNIVAICSDTHYKNKDFVITIESKAQIEDIIENRKHVNKSSENQKISALNYAIFMYDVVGCKSGLNFVDHYKNYNLNSLKFLACNQDPFWDNLCDSITEKYAFNCLQKTKRPIIEMKKKRGLD